MDNDGFRPLHPEYQQNIPAPISEISNAPNVKLTKWFKDWGLILLFAFVALIIALWPSKKKDKPKERDTGGNAPVVHIHNHGNKRVVKEEKPKKETPPKEEEPPKDDKEEEEEEEPAKDDKEEKPKDDKETKE